MENADGAIDREKQIEACDDKLSEMWEQMLVKLREEFGAVIVQEVVDRFHHEYNNPQPE